MQETTQQAAAQTSVQRVIVEPYLIRDGAEKAVTALLRAGAEFRATEEVLSRWLAKHGFATTERRVGDFYRAQRTNGLRLIGQDRWPTYHEMLADLLARIDANGGAP